MSKKKALDKVNAFLTKHNATLNETAQKLLSEFEFEKDTKINDYGDSIEICNDSKFWHTSLSINKYGISTFSAGNMLL